MNKVIYLLLGTLSLIMLQACGQDPKKETGEDTSAEASGGVQVMSTDPGWSLSPDQNPIPPLWRPYFRWVANGEVDSLYMLFSDGMYFAVNESNAQTPQEARGMLFNFYRQNKPLSFTYKHNGQSQSGIAQYAIGELATAQTNYRVTIVVQHGSIVSLDYELP